MFVFAEHRSAGCCFRSVVVDAVVFRPALCVGACGAPLWSHHLVMRFLHEHLAVFPGLPDAARRVLHEFNSGSSRSLLKASALANGSAGVGSSVLLDRVLEQPSSVRQQLAHLSTDPVLLSRLCEDGSSRVARAAVFNPHTPWDSASVVVDAARSGARLASRGGYGAFCGRSDSGHSWYAASLMALASAHAEFASMVLADPFADGTAVRAVLSACGVGRFLPERAACKIGKAAASAAAVNPDVPSGWLSAHGVSLVRRDGLVDLLAGRPLDVAAADPDCAERLVALGSPRLDLAVVAAIDGSGFRDRLGVLEGLLRRRGPCPDGFVFAAAYDALLDLYGVTFGSGPVPSMFSYGSRARCQVALRWSRYKSGFSAWADPAELAEVVALWGESEDVWRLGLSLFASMGDLGGMSGMTLAEVAEVAVSLSV